MAAAAPALRDVSLDDKYALESGRVYLTGAQALVRLADPAAAARRARRPQHRGLRLRLSRLAARRARPVAVEGAEVPRARAHQVPARAERGPRRDGGVGLAAGEPVSEGEVRRRLRDVVRQGSGRGPLRRRVQARAITPAPPSTAACWCSPATTTARSPRRCRTSRDHVFSAAMIPVLYPSSVQEILDLGLHGWAMSRYSGCWVGFKCVADTVESSSSVVHRSGRARRSSCPTTFRSRRTACRSAGPTARSRPKPGCRTTRSTRRSHYCRVNRLNRIVIDSPKPRLGIITSGKSYLDVRQALDDLGITEADAARDRPSRLQDRA